MERRGDRVWHRVSLASEKDVPAYEVAADVAGPQARQDLALGHDRVHRPARGAAHVHVLDEANLGGHGAPELDEVGQLIIVDAAHDDGVELQ